MASSRGWDGSGRRFEELSFRRITDLKQLELFDREADALATIDHPGIPKLIDRFVVEDDRFVSAYIAQEFVDGGQLEVGERWTEDDAREFLREMSFVLDEIHERSKPIVHRDIKPSNVMRREDGRFVLIDFGSITAAVQNSLGGSTVAGTLGYMAPEQLAGKASPASDFYGLGATMAALLTATPGHELFDPTKPGRWKSKTAKYSGLKDVLAGLLEQSPTRRIATGAELRNALDRRAQPAPAAKPKETQEPKRRKTESKPKTGPITIERIGTVLVLGVILGLVGFSGVQFIQLAGISSGPISGSAATELTIKDGTIRRTRIGKSLGGEWNVVVDEVDRGHIATSSVGLPLKSTSPDIQTLWATELPALWTFDNSGRGNFALVDLWSGKLLWSSSSLKSEARLGRIEKAVTKVELNDGTCGSGRGGARDTRRQTFQGLEWAAGDGSRRAGLPGTAVPSLRNLRWVGALEHHQVRRWSVADLSGE